MAQPPADLVAAHGIADAPPDHQPDLRGGRAGRRHGRTGGQPVHDEGITTDSPSPAEDGGEILATAKSRGGGQHAGQADRPERPLRRRAARMARPARVRIRNLNPCVFARRRLLGWNVRLLTSVSRCGSACRRAGGVPLPVQDMWLTCRRQALRRWSAVARQWCSSWGKRCTSFRFVRRPRQQRPMHCPEGAIRGQRYLSQRRTPDAGSALQGGRLTTAAGHHNPSPLALVTATPPLLASLGITPRKTAHSGPPTPLPRRRTRFTSCG